MFHELIYEFRCTKVPDVTLISWFCRLPRTLSLQLRWCLSLFFLAQILSRLHIISSLSCLCMGLISMPMTPHVPAPAPFPSRKTERFLHWTAGSESSPAPQSTVISSLDRVVTAK